MRTERILLLFNIMIVPGRAMEIDLGPGGQDMSFTICCFLVVK